MNFLLKSLMQMILGEEYETRFPCPKHPEAPHPQDAIVPVLVRARQCSKPQDIH